MASATHDAQPAVVIAGLFLNQKNVLPITHEFIRIKRNFYPKRLNVLKHDLEGLRLEIKGSDLRSEIRKHVAAGDAKKLRYRLRYVRAVLGLLTKFDARYVASVWIKAIGQPVKHDAVYTTSVQHICMDFHHLLRRHFDHGFVIADFRDPGQNNIVSHAVATQKLKATGDAFPRIYEAPTFAVSNNHAALQITDILCSTLLYPIAVHAYCSGYVANGHVRAEDARFKTEFGASLQALQYRYRKRFGLAFKKIGGAHVHDSHAGRNAWHLFN